MKLYLDCIPCFQKQALFAAKEQVPEKQADILKKVMSFLLETNWDTSPDIIANNVHFLLRNELNISDPYFEIKKESNENAQKLIPKLFELLKKTETKKERLLIAAKITIAGNIIDFGPAFDFDLEKTIKEVLEKKLALNDFDIFFEKILTADKLLYFADNAGEIVFDKLFIEEMILLRKKPFTDISFIIKGGPILNDAMLEDIYAIGMEDIPNINFNKIGNGQKGTGPDRRDNTVKEWIQKTDLVISKGQGNFEGLSENEGIFFMLMAKCPVIAKELGVEVKDTIIKYN